MPAALCPATVHQAWSPSLTAPMSTSWLSPGFSIFVPVVPFSLRSCSSEALVFLTMSMTGRPASTSSTDGFTKRSPSSTDTIWGGPLAATVVPVAEPVPPLAEGRNTPMNAKTSAATAMAVTTAHQPAPIPCRSWRGGSGGVAPVVVGSDPTAIAMIVSC